MSRLIDLIARAGARTIAVVGIAKNVGKTTTLNHIIEEAQAEGYSLGLTSIGRDGEKVDTVTRLPKPPVRVPAGALLATALEAIRESRAPLEVIGETPYETRLGRVLLARAVEAGEVVLVGPSTISQMRECLRLLHDQGCSRVLADGAFDRVASAAPGVTEATILATGAALGPSMRLTLERTRQVVRTFRLPAVADPGLREMILTASARREVAVVDGEGNYRALEIRTGLEQAEAISRALPRGGRGIIFGGALTGRMLDGLMAAGEHLAGLDLMVADPTRVFIDGEHWTQMARLGLGLKVARDINLLAVTTNPWAPVGPSYQPEEFLEAVGELLHPLPVFDVVLGRQALGRRGSV